MPNEIDPSKVKWDAPPPIDPRQVKWDAPAAPTQAELDAVNPATGMPWYEKALVGAGAATDRAVRGVGNLIADVGGRVTGDDMRPKGQPDQGAEDAALYQKYYPGGWATAGEIAADVGMSAIPVMKAGGVLTRTLGKLGARRPSGR